MKDGGVRQSKFVQPLWLVAASFLLFTGCTGGSSAGGAGQNQIGATPDFKLAVTPAVSSVVDGISTSVTLSANAVNGFTGQISIQITGLPTGVSAPVASLTPGVPQQIVFSSPVGTPTTVGQTVTFTGTSGSLSHIAQLRLSVFDSLSNIPPSRTRYVRTDAVTEYFQWLNTHWIVYNPNTSRFFMTDPLGNQVFAVDALTETKVATISVPGAFGIDDTPDHSTLYVGTLIGDVYTIDAASMTVTHRYLASQIGPSGGYHALTALVLADGRLALLGAQGGIPSVDGSTSFAVWNPIDNSLAIYAPLSGGGGVTPVCQGMVNIGGFTRTVDRTKIILGSIDSDGTLCEVNPSNGQDLHVQQGGFGAAKIVTSPDGKYIVLPGCPNPAFLYDAQTLNKISQFNVFQGTCESANFFFSADSQTLFFTTDTIIYAFNVATLQQIGWIPNIFLETTSGGFDVGPANSPALQATDGAGLFAGPVEEGIGFIDMTLMQTGPVGTQFTNAYLNPATGPTTGGTQTQWSAPATVSSQSSIYFGSQLSPSISNSGTNLSVTTPPGLPGPVDIYVMANDGGMQIIPEGFSYGPTILEVTPNTATQEGGGIGVIYGYGLGPQNATTIPSDLQVAINGQPVALLGFASNAYGLMSPPFLLQAVVYKIPPGVPGVVDVTVSTAAGTATVPSALTYLPRMQLFSSNGALLVQGIYNPHQDLYYFTDVHKLQVFSKTAVSWLPPIAIPAPPGATQRLWGIALSPDGSKLAISDITGQVIYLLNPSNPTSVQTFHVPQPNTGVIVNASGIAVSDAGMIYYATFVQGGTGYSSYFKLDTTTGAIKDYQIDGPQYYVNGQPQDVYLRAAISSDNSRVFFNNDGYVFGIDTATDTIVSSPVGPGCCYGDYDLALSNNQKQLEATSYLYDSNLNAESALALNDREILNTSYVYGVKFSPDGSLLFQPSASGIDVFDGRVGTLRNRIALPVTLAPFYDALVSDGKDNVLIAITGSTGSEIAIIDLSSLAEPNPLPYNSAITSLLSQVRISEPQVARLSSDRSTKPPERPRAVPHITSGSFR